MITIHEQIPSFHRALYVACGLPALTPGVNDSRRWADFLFALTPLDDPHAGGPLTAFDIRDVVQEMQRQNKAGQASWSIRPQKILGEPEAFLDLVLIARKRRAARPNPAPTRITEQQVGDARRQIEEPTAQDPQRVDPSDLIAEIRRARAASTN